MHSSLVTHFYFLSIKIINHLSILIWQVEVGAWEQLEDVFFFFSGFACICWLVFIMIPANIFTFWRCSFRKQTNLLFISSFQQNIIPNHLCKLFYDIALYRLTYRGIVSDERLRFAAQLFLATAGFSCFIMPSFCVWKLGFVRGEFSWWT